MLVFRTVFPLINTISIQEFINLSIQWIDRSPHYELRGRLNAYYGTKDFVVYSDNEHFESAFHEEENKISVCILFERNDTSRRWRTEIVFLKESKYTLCSINVYCESDNFENYTNWTQKPYFIKLINAKQWFGTDGNFRISDDPYAFSPDEVKAAAKIINGDFKTYLPCVYISKNQEGEYSIDVDKIAQKLVGIAHVFLEPSIYFSHDLRKLTRGYNPYLGAIGIFFPHHGKRILYRPLVENNYSIPINLFYNEVKNALTYGQLEEALSYSAVKSTWLRQQVEKNKNDSLDYQEYAEQLEKEKDDEIKKLKNEIIGLQKQLDILNNKHRNDENGMVLKRGKVIESYSGQINDTLIEVLEQGKKSLPPTSRRYQLLDELLKYNKKGGGKEKILEKLESILKGYRTVNDSMESGLKRLGFIINRQGAHPKLSFANYPNAQCILTTSGSDSRNGKNAIAHIKQYLL